MRAASILAIALALASCGRGGGEDGGAGPRVIVEHASVTLPAVPGRPGAAYYTLESNAGAALVGIASPRFERAELHDAGMRPAARFPISADAPLVFAPGGRHAMLYGLDAALRPGDRIALIFTFEGAPAVTATAEVRAPGDVVGDH